LNHTIPNFDNASIYKSESEVYRTLHFKISQTDGLVFASPAYNLTCCAELKKLVEYVGSTPEDGSLRGALFDKVVTFVNSAGLPHSYTAFTGLANSLMLDFKCIINPYNLYVHSKQWTGSERLCEAAQARFEKSMQVAVELTTLLAARTYRSRWEI
jgi:FMN reductase